MKINLEKMLETVNAFERDVERMSKFDPLYNPEPKPSNEAFHYPPSFVVDLKTQGDGAILSTSSFFVIKHDT